MIFRVFNGYVYQRLFRNELDATEYCMQESKKYPGIYHFNFPDGGYKRFCNGDLIASYYPIKKERIK